ncbi:MAG: MarR family transcriptional regulator [Chloroflexota bacterium]|nr:MarR family transcriptional regulator [Anaerolineales bacterium]
MAAPEQQGTIDWLFVQVCRLHYIRAHAVLEEIGLYRGQPPVLFHLQNQDGLSHSELGQRLQVSPATVTKMIQRMEKAGFVQRQPDADDQRVSRVYLTEAGRAIHVEVIKRYQLIESEAFAGFSSEDETTMRRLLSQMRENLRKVVDESPSA